MIDPKVMTLFEEYACLCTKGILIGNTTDNDGMIAHFRSEILKTGHHDILSVVDRTLRNIFMNKLWDGEE